MLTKSRRLGVLALLASAMVTFGPATAYADGGTGAVNCGEQDPQPGCTVDVSSPGNGGAVTPGQSSDGECHRPDGMVIPCQTADGWAGSDGCYYKLAGPEDISAVPPPADTTGAWYIKTCSSDPDLSSQSLVFLPVPPVADPQVLAQQARSMLRLPAVVILLNPTGDQLVGLPTWLALDPESWSGQSATATVPGVSVTATATPVRAVWQMGDGSTVVCSGPGTVWQAGMDPAAESPDCGYLYLATSAGRPGGMFTMTVSITWNVAWAGAGAGGVVAGLTTTGTVQVRVAEASVVNTQ